VKTTARKTRMKKSPKRQKRVGAGSSCVAFAQMKPRGPQHGLASRQQEKHCTKPERAVPTSTIEKVHDREDEIGSVLLTRVPYWPRQLLS
jgi:hypothetical protein